MVIVIILASSFGIKSDFCKTYGPLITYAGSIGTEITIFILLAESGNLCGSSAANESAGTVAGLVGELLAGCGLRNCIFGSHFEKKHTTESDETTHLLDRQA